MKSTDRLRDWILKSPETKKFVGRVSSAPKANLVTLLVSSEVASKITKLFLGYRIHSRLEITPSQLLEIRLLGTRLLETR